MRLRSSAKDQVHAVLAKLGIPVTCSDLFGALGSAWLDGLEPAPAVCREGRLAAAAHRLADRGDQPARRGDRRPPRLLPAVPGGAAAARDRPGAGRGGRRRDRRHQPVPRPRPAVQLGRADPAAPRVRRQGRPRAHHQAGLARPCGGPWSRRSSTSPPAARPASSRTASSPAAAREARNIAKIAAARKLLTCVFYAMRDGQVRSLAPRSAQRPGEQARTRAARDRLQVWPPPPGGAAAALIDPAARTRTAPCPRGRQPREPRRDDRSQAPATDKAAPWGRNTTTHRRPFPAAPSSDRGRPASRTPAAPLPRPGSAGP